MKVPRLLIARGLAAVVAVPLAACLPSGCGKSPDSAESGAPPAESLHQIPPPDLDIPTKKPVKIPPFLYVKTAFQSESDYGTHEFPVGAKVAVLDKQGDSYLVELNGVSVLNGPEFFSETMVDVQALASPTPTPPPPPAPDTATAQAPANDEDYISAPVPPPTPTPGDVQASVPSPEVPASAPSPEPVAAVPAASPEPSPLAPEPLPVTEEDRKVSEISEKIRDISEEIDKASGTGSNDQDVQKLRKQRDRLSEELTTLTKP